MACVWISETCFPDRVRVKNGLLVMDAAPANALHIRRANVHMEVRTGDWENWDSYTLTCRIRFDEFPRQKTGEFYVWDRRGEGCCGVVTVRYMLIDPAAQRVQVYTIPPNAEDEPAGIKGRIHRETLERQHLRRPIELNQWIPIEIVAEKNFFEYHYDGNLVTRYEDETAVPGTVSFLTLSGLVVHLDDVTITGVGVPHSVNHETNIATTWGDIKNSSRR